MAPVFYVLYIYNSLHKAESQCTCKWDILQYHFYKLRHTHHKSPEFLSMWKDKCPYFALMDEVVKVVAIYSKFGVINSAAEKKNI